MITVKKSLLVLLTVALWLPLFAQWKDGTYTGKAIGKSSRRHSGEVAVTVTVNGGKINAIDMKTYDQSSRGKYGDLAKKAKKQVPAAVIEKQSIAVDGVSGATISSNAIFLAVARALEKAR